MNSDWSCVVRSTYRREPIVSFMLTAGVVEAAIGGLHEHWSLLALGLGTVGAAIVLRWQQHRQVARLIERAPTHALPASDARSRLPELKPKRKPPGSKY
ncbi:MAG: hypothetical protein KME27_27680 [Lyngbya sp. HA4199-MV5]|jgi:hypothetical protein|nr:hypothetical protein [Lyngbya sp. HA4199-MV5]